MTRHILIVDNDPIFRKLLKAILREERAQDCIRTAESAADALALLRSQPADLLITDLQMPESDGLTLIETTHRLYPQTRCILLTTADQSEVKERSRNRPATFTLFPKPFAVEPFLTHIARTLALLDTKNTISDARPLRQKLALQAL